MSRQILGWTGLFAGWATFLLALACPAIEFSSPGLDMGPWRETKSGLTCLGNTFDPRYWLFAPLLGVYLWANLVILTSPIVVGRWESARAPCGVQLLVAFVFSLSAPVCAQEVNGVLVGAYAWMASFLLAGLGCLMLREPEKTPAKHVAAATAPRGPVGETAGEGAG